MEDIFDIKDTLPIEPKTMGTLDNYRYCKYLSVNNNRFYIRKALRPKPVTPPTLDKLPERNSIN